MKLLKVLILLLFFFFIASCQHDQYSTKKKNYLRQSMVVNPIVQPSGVKIVQQKPYYVIPIIHKSYSHAKVRKPLSLQPPSLLKN